MQALLSALLPTTSSNSSLQVQATASPAARSAQAVAYLAHTLLAEGAVQQAVQLHRTAVQLNPRCSSCALGLAQTLEVQCDYAGVLQALLGFCRSNLGLLQVGPLSLQVRVCCQQLNCAC
jgi:hypothetical protein